MLKPRPHGAGSLASDITFQSSVDHGVMNKLSLPLAHLVSTSSFCSAHLPGLYVSICLLHFHELSLSASHSVHVSYASTVLEDARSLDDVSIYI
jgi:hypothetical protein